MKPSDQSLRRLLDAAAKATPEALGDPPLGFETRVLAHWRAAQADEEPAFLFLFLRRAAVGASLVLLLSAAWSLTSPAVSPTNREAALLDYQIQMSLSP
jgi:hypothetical protein